MRYLLLVKKQTKLIKPAGLDARSPVKSPEQFEEITLIVPQLHRSPPQPPPPTRTSKPQDSTRSDESAIWRRCPAALRNRLLDSKLPQIPQCRCKRNLVPRLTDLEYDQFIASHIPSDQLLIVYIINSDYPEASGSAKKLETHYLRQQKGRTSPCTQSMMDDSRIFFYDVRTAADLTDYSQPLLVRRHNASPGFFLMYVRGNLFFCDHILDGYGFDRRYLERQAAQVRKSAREKGRSLPHDFRFSPLQGRPGARAAYGGQMAGPGVDYSGNPGLSSDYALMELSASIRDKPLESQIG